MVEKLNVKLKNVKEHDSPIFQFNGLALKQGEEFAHSFNVKQIEYIEAKLTKFTQDMEGHTQTAPQQKEKEKKITAESQAKEKGSGLKPTSNEFMESVLESRWEMIFPNDLCTLLAWPSRKCIKVVDAATSLFTQDGPYIAQLLEGNYFSNAARSRITTNLQQEVRDYVYTFIYPEEYTLTESISKTDSHSSTSDEEAVDDSEGKDECQ